MALRLVARVGSTEAKCLMRTLAILIGSLITLSESEGSLMEGMDLLFFDLRASMLLIHPHVFLILVKLESKSFKWYCCAQILRCKLREMITNIRYYVSAGHNLVRIVNKGIIDKSSRRATNLGWFVNCGD